MRTTPARFASGLSVVSGWSSLVLVATADTARVRAVVYGIASDAFWRALMTRAAAISSIALVIFLMDWTDLMRWR
jgi:hypothetical protein